MDLLNDANHLKPLFQAVGTSHCALAHGGGPLIARAKPAVGAYTVDVYIKEREQGSEKTFVFLSKGVARDMGLPAAPMGNNWADGDYAKFPIKLVNVYDGFNVTTDWSWSIEQQPGSDPNIVRAIVTPVVHTTGSLGAGSHVVAHRHAYSIADWLTGVVHYAPSDVGHEWHGGIAATKILPLPLSRAAFWGLFVEGALSKVRSDAASKIRAQCKEVDFGIDMNEPANFGLDFYWDAATGAMSVGRGMGSHSVAGASGTAYDDNVSTQGDKVVGGVGIRATLVVHHVDAVFTTSDVDVQSVAIPPYNMSYKQDVGTGRVLLASSATNGKVLSDLTRLCSEVFPASFDRELDSSSTTTVYLDEVFAATAETAQGTAANRLQSEAISSGASPSMPTTPASAWTPKYQDFASVCMRAFELAVRAAANG